MSSTCAALVVAGLLGLAGTTISPGPADAAVYCKTAGVPQGCVMRPTPVAAAAVVTPAVGVARVGVAGVGVGARGVGVRPGTPMNRGGPVNRVGRR